MTKYKCKWCETVYEPSRFCCPKCSQQETEDVEVTDEVKLEDNLKATDNTKKAVGSIKIPLSYVRQSTNITIQVHLTKEPEQVELTLIVE